MALLIDIGWAEWMSDAQLAEILAPMLPGATVHIGDDGSVRDDVTMLAVSTLRPGIAGRLPNLQLVQKLGAGVETIVGDPDLAPGVRVARLKPSIAADEIAEYCLAYALREQRNMRLHERDAAAGRWNPTPPRKTADTVAAVLGLGHIGGRTARLFASLGFRTMGWSRSQKSIDGVDCRFGVEGLRATLAAADYVAAILPSTAETRGMLDASMLGLMKPGAMLINAGRGDLIVEADLLAALDAARPAHAVLDVLPQEPLPSDHPFWRHPKITVTPHVSGWRVDGGLEDVAENFRRLQDGRPLLHEVDRSAGY